MRVHANAKLGPAGRLALVKKVLEGESLRTAAAESSVSVATAHRWLHRWLDASVQQRCSGSWLEDRSSRPRRSPRRLTSEQEAPILRARERTGLGRRDWRGSAGELVRRSGRSSRATES